MDLDVPTKKKIAIGGGVVGVLGLLAALFWKRSPAPASPADGTSDGTMPPAAGSSPDPTPGAAPTGIAACIVAKCLWLLPEPTSVLGVGDARWDNALGGSTGKNTWGYYSLGYGTTCEIFCAWILSLCAVALQLPASVLVMINRKPPEGQGFVKGQHGARLYQGAKALGWVMTPQGGVVDFQPGDIYCIHHPAEHMGIILTGGSSGTIETCDGGQTASDGGQCAKRCKRTLVGTVLTMNGIPGAVQWWIRPQGIVS